MPTGEVRARVLVSAGKRDKAELVERCVERLRAAGLRVDAPLWGDPERLGAAVAEAGPDDLIVAGGGDGTLNALLAPLVASGATLLVLPLGTANDFARSLGLPRDPEQAVAAALAGRRRRVSLGEVDGRLFHSVASLGLGPAVTKRLDAAMKRRWGKLSYALALLACLRRLRSFAAIVTVDGQAHRLRSIQIGVANGDYQGGGMPVAPHRTLAERQLLLYSLPHRPVWKLLLLAVLAKLRLHELAGDVTYLRGREIAVVTRRHLRIDADGEPLGETPARFRIHVEALNVMVPQASGLEKESAA